jgi:outer membrane biosynthesis protein TonB
MNMMDKKLFTTGLIFSFCIHVGMIGLLSLTKSKKSFFTKPLKSIEISYQNINSLNTKKKETVFKNLKVTKSQKPQQPQKVKVLSKKNNMLSAIGERIQDISKISGKLAESQKKTPQISMIDISHKITISPISTEKITNPKYLSYNDDMRATISSNIKQRAYMYVNHKDFQAGKVYVTFVLASSGMLKQVQIIEGKTLANDYLRTVALKSIKESSPFPPFPIGFNYPEFTFNLLISFQE